MEAPRVHFAYEITADDYVAAQTLYYKSYITTRKHIERAAGWSISGLVFILISWNEWGPIWAPILLAAIGVWWVYSGISMLFPSRYFRRAYRSFPFAGTPFEADVDESGFEIKSGFNEWIVRWPGVQLRDEDDKVFIFVSGGTIFIFGKKYLNSEQQHELRRFSGLRAREDSPPITNH